MVPSFQCSSSRHGPVIWWKLRKKQPIYGLLLFLIRLNLLPMSSRTCWNSGTSKQGSLTS